MHESNVAKFAIEVEIDRGKPLSTFLWEYDKTLPLVDNIKKIVNQHNQRELDPLATNVQYALKLLPDSKHPNFQEHFITDPDKDIKDGYSIKLVLGVAETVRRLFDIRMDNEWLLQLSNDDVFVKEIVDHGRHLELMDRVMKGSLNDDGESAALNVVYHLMKNGYQRCLDDIFVEKIVGMAQNDKLSSAFAISLLVHILKTNKEALASNKVVILEGLEITHIMKKFNLTEIGAINDDGGFDLRIFCLINALIVCAKGKRRKDILEELNAPENKRIFYDFLKKNQQLEPRIAREIFMLQARLMTNEYVGFYTNNRKTMSASIYEESPRASSGSDFENIDFSARSTMFHDGAWVSNLQKASSMVSILSVSSMNKSSGSPLLHKCLEYGKRSYKTYFDSLEKSDYSCDAELYTISQNIISILTNLLCIGVTVHAHNYYLPIFFAPLQERRDALQSFYPVSFFEELFVKTLMLLFHTKAEMKAKTKDDFKKLYQVLKLQLKLIFERHPLDFDELDTYLTGVKYKIVQEILQKERDKRWKKIYTENQSVRELVAHFSVRNEGLITLSRYNILEKGFIFRNMNSGYKGKYFSLTLMPDWMSLLYADCARSGAHITDGRKMCIYVESIKHIVYGENSNLRSNNIVSANKTNCVFTIVFNVNESFETDSIDCYFHKDDSSSADSLKEMETLTNLWKDGLMLLTRKGVASSTQMKEELDELNELDCKLQLIELQDIEIPMSPPEVPEYRYNNFL